MESNSKKLLKTAVVKFYKVNLSKGKEYTFKNFKNGGVHKTTIYQWHDNRQNQAKGDWSSNCNQDVWKIEGKGPYGKWKWLK